MPNLSAIIPSFNEINNDAFWANVAILGASQDAELIVVDGGSTDGTRERLAKSSAHIIAEPDSTRARRYNAGVAAASGRTILLVHPRSRITENALVELASIGDSTWGAFRHSFDWPHPLLRFTSWYSNHVRGRRGIYYLDHCLFFTADLREHARFPDVSIFEDTYFCRALRRQQKPKLMKSNVVTSAVRFRRNGVLKQSLMNQVLKLLFCLGVSESHMNRIYERGLWLNSKT